LRTLAALIVGLSLLALAGAHDARAGLVFGTTFSVDTTADDPSLTACTAAANDCSLRGAIIDSNANSSADIIDFHIGIGSKVIIVSAAQGQLPSITEPVTIDAGTQTCSIAADHPPCIFINGGLLPCCAGGLTVLGTDVNVTGLGMGFFAGNAINYAGNSTGTVRRSFLGTADGINPTPNNSGVDVNSPGGVTIGGPAVADRNVISGNTGFNVVLNGDGAVVQNNYIGVTMNGDAAVGATQTGILVNSGSHDNLIGKDGIGNVISGSTKRGVILRGHGAHVESNLIGLNAAGTAAIPSAVGVEVTGSDNVIGGDTDNERNVISGNTQQGILARFDQDDPSSPTPTDNSISGNFIGTNPAGDAAIPNNLGVEIDAPSTNTLIGGNSSGERNIISGNGTQGIFASGGTNITISGNYIGSDMSGTKAVPNSLGGIFSYNSPGLIIGGDTSGERNVISGNGNGIGTSAQDDMLVKGNYIGLNSSGDAAVPNTGWGILLFPGGTGNSEDTTNDNEISGNVISGNTFDGIAIQPASDQAAADNNTITNNIIGLNASRNAIIPNGGDGVEMGDGHGQTVGNSISQNSIDGNGSLGIEIVSVSPIPEPPVLTSAVTGSTHVAGTLASFARQEFTIEFFSSPACDGSGSGEGRSFLGSQTVHTSGSGNGTIDATLSEAPIGSSISATATDEDGSTSRFSNCVTVTGATPTPSPAPTPSPTASAGVLGDANCNSSLDNGDIIAALSESAGVAPGTDCLATADANCNGHVDSEDALRIVAFLADVALPKPAGCSQVGDPV